MTYRFTIIGYGKDAKSAEEQVKRQAEAIKAHTEGVPICVYSTMLGLIRIFKPSPESWRPNDYDARFTLWIDKNSRQITWEQVFSIINNACKSQGGYTPSYHRAQPYR